MESNVLPSARSRLRGAASATSGKETANMTTTIGILGSGHVGSNLAKAAVAHGYDVVLSSTREPGTLSGLVRELGPGARAATPAEAAAAGDFSIVAIPLTTIGQVPVEPLGERSSSPRSTISLSGTATSPRSTTGRPQRRGCCRLTCRGAGWCGPSA